MQGTDSPPSCSLTCSPDRTIKKSQTKDESMAVQSPLDKKLLQLHCRECQSNHMDSFIPYRGNPHVGNCEQCGCFRNLTSVHAGQPVSEALRDNDMSFKTEVPMDMILSKLVEDATQLNPQYNPRAFYTHNREIFVNWIFELAEKLRVQPETFHHAINLYDAYLMQPDIQQMVQRLRHLQNHTKHDIESLVALTSLFLSAKYLEKTYPGIG